MTKYFTNFDADSIGGLPNGWSKQWSAIADATYLYAIRNGTPAVKRRYLDTAQTNATYGALAYPIGAADVDVLTCYYVEASNPDTNALIPARSSGTAGAEQCYALDLGIAGAYLQIGRVVGGAFTGLASTAFTASAGTWYFLRFRVTGTGAPVTLTAKAWAVGTPEASATTVTFNDTSGSRITTTGSTGIWSYGANGNGRWNFFSSATGGVVAVTPLLNTEYSAWLGESHERRVLADLQVTGYDSGAVGAPYHATRRVYLANGGYTTQEQDSPATRHYSPWMEKAPTFRREMGVALSGNLIPGFGDLIVSNPRPAGSTDAVAGVRDDWLRMKWIRYVKLYIGDPTWPKHDFRTILVGRIEQPLAPDVGSIRFRLRDMADAFDVPVSSTRFSSGPFDGQLKPRLFGRVALIEPPLTDEATNEFTIDDGPITEPTPPARAFEEGIALETVAGLTVAAVNTGTETITASANHGLATDWRVRFNSGTPPAGLSLATDYYVIAAGLTATDFRLSATVGGAAVNLTSGTTGAAFMGYSNRFDLAAGKMYIAGNITGRIMVGNDGEDGLEDDAGISSEYLVANLYDQLIFEAAGVSRELKDDDSFNTLAALSGLTGKCGIWVDTRPHQVAEILDRVARETFTWFGQAPDGQIQVGAIGVPAATAVMSFTESQVTALTLKAVRRPMNFANYTLKYRPRFFASGPIQSTDPAFNADYLLSNITPVESSAPPLDNMLSVAERDEGLTFNTLFLDDSDMASRFNSIYFNLCATFEFRTTLRALELSIGDTISLTHSRLGWKNWTGSDDPSPDNTNSFDGRLAVVIGHAVDLNDTSGFPVTLTVNRRMPGYYPTADLN